MQTVEQAFGDAWREMLQTLGASEEVATPMKAEVVARHAEPERAYHNLSHAVRVWTGVKKYALAEGIADTGAVQMAALLHDVIYDPKRQDNEALSADFAVRWGQILGVAPPTVDRAAEIILATQKHGPTASAEIGLVLDADLAILAAPPAEYDAYRDAIRREYAWVTEADWVAGRGRILAAFLEREQIYHLPSLRTRWEAAARENITREMAGLSKLALSK
jgi:predicted metal-dependent HD superfamily phosphohydrolase